MRVWVTRKVEKTNPTKQGLKLDEKDADAVTYIVEKTNPTKQGLKQKNPLKNCNPLKMSKRLIQQNKD